MSDKPSRPLDGMIQDALREAAAALEKANTVRYDDIGRRSKLSQAADTVSLDPDAPSWFCSETTCSMRASIDGDRSEPVTISNLAGFIGEAIKSHEQWVNLPDPPAIEENEQGERLVARQMGFESGVPEAGKMVLYPFWHWDGIQGIDGQSEDVDLVCPARTASEFCRRMADAIDQWNPESGNPMLTRDVAYAVSGGEAYGMSVLGAVADMWHMAAKDQQDAGFIPKGQIAFNETLMMHADSVSLEASRRVEVLTSIEPSRSFEHGR